ncbi:PKD domain-containing protein [Aquirufa sp. ROCK2-A2]
MKTRLNTLLFLILFFSVAKAQTYPALSQQSASHYVIKDTLFKVPFIDIDEWRDKPVRHRYVHGGFEGTTARFSFYFPQKEQYQGRFFQYITPVPDNENLSQGAKGEEDKIGFSIASGAYFVETNGGGNGVYGKNVNVNAFRANAAAAAFSKVVAQQIFGAHRTYGYCFGGSGGAYRTIGGFENSDVWDGAVPYVVGSPVAIPNVFSIRMHAMRILKDKFPSIIDAMDTGGSGDPYAGLNLEEKEALLEVTKMGFPPQSWFGYKSMGIHGFAALYQGMMMADRNYFTDFWVKPGYLGSNPTPSLLRARIQHPAKIKRAISVKEAISLGLSVWAQTDQNRGTADAAWQRLLEKEDNLPVAFELDQTLPAIDFLGGDLFIKSGNGKGKNLFVSQIKGDIVIFAGGDANLIRSIQIGDDVQVDNSNFLAAQTYHRHQVPGKGYTVWNQFLDKEGKPIYPQRPMQLGPLFTRGASGILPTGKFKGKMILLESLYDREAYPWQADWYVSRAKEFLGDSLDKNFRVWYTDKALHGDVSEQEFPTRSVSYLGVLQQALRDVSQWAEKGVAPPTSTSYTIADGQVVVPSDATIRKGIQASVQLTITGKKKIETKRGQIFVMKVATQLPPNAGKIVSVEWDLDGSGKFATKENKVALNKNGVFQISHSYSKPGVYFPTVRIASERNGDANTPFARIQNLDRVRVIVK